MNLKERIQSILQLLKLTDKAKSEEGLSTEEWNSVMEEYKKKFNAQLADDITADQKKKEEEAVAEKQQELLNTVQAMLNEATPTNETTTDDSKKDDPKEDATLETISATVKKIAINTAKLGAQAQEDKPKEVITVNINRINGPGTTKQYLFGIENSIFSMDKRWNQIAASPRAALSMEEPTTADLANVGKEIISYSNSLRKRYNFLHTNNLLDAKKLAAGTFATDYSGVDNAGLGDQYVVLRQDALIARILAVRDLTQIFPVRYGIQDRDLVFNAFFSEVSQAYQEGEVFKGDIALENEMGYVDDAMIKLKFGPMKDLERKYIGYLNKEGSDPIKWTMIEFCILNSLKNAQVEQNKRRMRGIYVTPETGVAGSSLNTSTGILYTLIRYYHQNCLKLHADQTYRSYTKSTMLDVVQEFNSDVVESVMEDDDTSDRVLYLNALHKSWWIECVRAKYGKDTDFTGPTGSLNILPDTDRKIVWLPYLGNMKLMFMDIPGNLQFLENLPGEMFSLQLKDDMELVKGWSTWKEGCAAAFTGRHFSSKSDLDENNYVWQQIFMNKPAETIAADAVTADASINFWFETGVNTKATALTNIINAKNGPAYIIETGDITFATTISKAGNFSNITADFVPTAIGDYIMVVLRSDNKFAELERTVGGVRVVNKALQPNVPGVR